MNLNLLWFIIKFLDVSYIFISLIILTLFTDAILNTYPATKEIEFEETVAEWFRFAKQRRTRTAEKEKKKVERRK